MTDRTRTAPIMDWARRECERRLDAGEPLAAVERYIEAVPVSPDARAALWLWAVGRRGPAGAAPAGPAGPPLSGR
jgi:hypothetical protein